MGLYSEGLWCDMARLWASELIEEESEFTMPTTKLGEVVLGARILLIDPCYHFGGKLSDGVSRRCVPGSWEIFYEYEETCYGIAPIKLIAVAPNDEVPLWKTIKHYLAVDGAALGIFDCERYPRVREGNKLVTLCEDFQDRYHKAFAS